MDHMSRFKKITAALLVASFVGMTPVAARADDGGDRRHRHSDRWDGRDDRDDRYYRDDRYDRDRRHDRDGRWDRGYGDGWDPTPYYRRDERRYRARRMSYGDRIYRGSDNRYYCRRDDGTAGLIVGGIAGGVLGNVIAPRRSKTIGTIIGASAGAILGKKVDDGNIVCR
jgi:hypothetical protein